MQHAIRSGIAFAVLLVLGSCGAGEGSGAPSDGTILGTGTTSITIFNTSSVDRKIMYQRFYNYDTGQYEEDNRVILSIPGKNSSTWSFPRGGTWNVDVDFEGGTGFHGNAPNPPWIREGEGGSVSFWRNW